MNRQLSHHASGTAIDLNASPCPGAPPGPAGQPGPPAVVLTEAGKALVAGGVPIEWVYAYGPPYVRPKTTEEMWRDAFEPAAHAISDIGRAFARLSRQIEEAFAPVASALSDVAQVTDGQVYPKDRPRHVSPHGPAPRRTRARR